MEQHGFSLGQREIGFVELRQGQVASARDLLAGVLVRLADIDEHGALIEKALGFSRGDCGERHGELLCLKISEGSGGNAEELVQRGEEFLDPGIGDPVPQRLALAPEGHQTLGTHLGQMLRQRGLRQADRLGQRVDVGFAAFHQPAQDHQAALVGQRTQDARHLRSLRLHHLRIETLRPFCLRYSILANLVIAHI